MANVELTPEQLEQNYNKFRSLCEKLGERAPYALRLVDDLGERLALAPASSRLEHHCAFPGGLIVHSMNVLINAKKLINTFEFDISKDALILCTLFHDIGKCAQRMPDGSFVDCYIPQDSSWHREKLGEMYKYNPEIPFMPVAVRSIFTLTQYGIALSHEEYVAILIHDGWILEENRKFIFKEPTLAMVLQMADYIATKQEKNND